MRRHSSSRSRRHPTTGTTRPPISDKGAIRRDAGFGIHAFEIRDGLVLYRPGAPDIRVLNETARYIWEGLSAGESVQGLAERFARRFRIPLDQARRDCERIRQDLDRDIPSPERPGPVASPSETATWASTHVSQPDACELRLRLGRTTFLLRTTGDVASVLEPVLGHLRLDSPGAAPSFRMEVVPLEAGFVLNAGGAELGRAADTGQMVHAVLLTIGRAACRHAQWLAILHAGAVARDGHCVLLPARGGSGKTTLVAALTQEGYTFLSDDVIALDETGVVALPLPMSVKQGSRNLVAQWFPRLAESPEIRIDGKLVRYVSPPMPADDAWERQHPVSLLVSPRYQEGARTEVREIGPAETLQMLFDANSRIAGRCTPERVERMVRWVESVPSYRLTYGNLDDALAAIEHLRTARR